MNYLVLDLETTGLNPRKDSIINVAYYWHPHAHVFEFEPKEVQDSIDYADKVIFHNFKFDVHFLELNGVVVPKYKIIDTMLMHHLYNENLSHGLDNIIQDLWKDNYKEVFWSKYKKYEEAPINERNEYAAKDVAYTWKLYEFLIPHTNHSLLHHVQEFAWYLYQSEKRGINLDTGYALKHKLDLTYKIKGLEGSLHEILLKELTSIEDREWEKQKDKRKTPKGKAAVPRPKFNFSSTKQLQELLYNELGLPVVYKEKSITTDDAALEKLKDLHPTIPLLQDYRATSKVLKAFIEPALEAEDNGKIYPSFNVNGTVTGRISSSNPNMQQLPSSGDIRGIYIPAPSNVFISCDYSQLEVTIAAHYTQDKNLLKIVLEGASQHDITSNSLSIPRQQAKTLNFAMQYGCSHFKVAKILGISIEEAKEIWDKYWQTYPGVKKIMDRCVKKVDTGSPIQNPIGRLRRFEVAKRQPWDSAYRQAWNSLIQGTGADITNWAFREVCKKLETNKRGYGLFPVHDEILIEVKEQYCKEAEEMLKQTMLSMKTVFNLTVPLKVESSGPMKRWLD